MKFKFKVLSGFFIIFFLAGCATTKTKEGNTSQLEMKLVELEHSQLQMKVFQLERKIEECDQVINELKYEVNELNDRVEELSNSSLLEPIEEPIQSTAPRPKRKSLFKKSGSKKASRYIHVSDTPKNIQTALKNAGYYDGEVDSRIGPRSKQAISEFQKDHGLESDGMIGERTWSELKKYLD